jgi:hypothetical protein
MYMTDNTNVDNFVKSVSPDAVLENRIETYDNIVRLYNTPGLQSRYDGVVAKTAAKGEAEMLLSREVGALVLAKDRMNGVYTVPELLAYSRDFRTLVEQRVYGERALDHADTPNKIDYVTDEMLKWLTTFHRNTTNRTSVNPENLDSMKAFWGMITNTNKLDIELKDRISRNLSRRMSSELTVEYGTLHGDFSPIDFYLGDDGNRYALDFNASHLGPVTEDVANFLGNSWFHYVNGGAHRVETAEILAASIDDHFEPEIKKSLPLFLAKMYFQQAITGSKSYYNKIIAEASNRLLEADEFEPDLLVFDV